MYLTIESIIFRYLKTRDFHSENFKWCHQYLKRKKILENIYVFDDGLIKGFIQIKGTEICQLFVEPFFQNEGIGGELIEFAIQEFQVDHVWALEKNIRAISFYQKHGFYMTGQKKFEEGTAECIVELEL